MRDWFYQLADQLSAALRGDEVFTLWLAAERSDFVRFNHGKVRQPGSVVQRQLRLRLIDGARQASVSLSLAGDAQDAAQLRGALAELRELLPALPQDPHLLYATAINSSESTRSATLPDAAEITHQVVRLADGHDLVGIHAQGEMLRGFANSLGQRNWHAVDSFNFEWSLYHRADKAVKTSYAGFDWQPQVFAQKLRESAEQLELLKLAPRRIEPGQYRAYLAPRALEEILGLLCWGGFSAKARASKRSPLIRMEQGEHLDARISLSENIAQGLGAAFQADGFVKPACVELIRAGQLGDALISPRSGKEYGLTHNAAGERESPEALDLAPGTLAPSEVLAALDTGLYVNNLWYLNYSDRAAARITGMTRFATFWVEAGRIVAPVDVMRFDDSVYSLLGSKLQALTSERELILDSGTYDARSAGSSRLPGCLVAAMRFTL